MKLAIIYSASDTFNYILFQIIYLYIVNLNGVYILHQYKKNMININKLKIKEYKNFLRVVDLK